MIKFSNEAREEIKAGVDILANAIKVTLGAKGRHVAIMRQNGSLHVTKDGVTVAREITLNDPTQKIGELLIKEVANKTVDVAGDGTTTATVLAQAMISLAMQYLNGKASPTAIKKGMEKAVLEIVAQLNLLSKPVDTHEVLTNIATISANNDPEIGKLIAEAYSIVGKDGLVKANKSNSNVTSVEKVDGMRIKSGYITPYFITNTQKMKCELKNPFILLYDKEITNINLLIPIVEKIVAVNSTRPLLIIAEDVKGEALHSMIQNKAKGNFLSCAIKAPSLGENQRMILEDIAALTGAKVISEAQGDKLEDTALEMLGQADNIIVERENTLIVGGKGHQEDIEGRCEQIRKRIEGETEHHTLVLLKERIAKLKNGIAILNIGGFTETEINEKVDRIEDALCATNAANDEGFVAGGGSTYLRCAELLKNLKGDSEDENIGIKIVLEAIEAPFKNILKNGDVEDTFSDSIKKEYGMGYNVKTDSWENLLQSGVIDPTKVLRVALENACSVTGIFITTECTVY